jgi:hypothetical protein
MMHEIAKIFSKPSIKLLVCGTGLLLADLEEAVASQAGVSKPQAVKVFHQIGMFDTWPN